MWCAICRAEKEPPFYIIGSRDGMTAFAVCDSHVPEEHLAENNEYHADRVLRQLILEDGQLVSVEWPVEQPAQPDSYVCICHRIPHSKACAAVNEVVANAG